MKVRMVLKAQKSEHFMVKPALTIRRADGVHITNLISDELFTVDLHAGQKFELEFDFGKLNLGDGRYLISLSIFRDQILEEYRYDLVAHAHEFEVTGNPTVLSSYVFVHPGNWTLHTNS